MFYWMPVKNRQHFSPATSPTFGFNPCFIGCRSKTLLAHFACHIILRFQSLFYWMPVKNFKGCFRHISVIARFQSLFYWMPVKNLLSSTHAIRNIGVSILVLLDAGQKHWGAMAEKRAIYAFQSLFYWMPVKNITLKMVLSIMPLGFNPCFIGCRSKTTYLRWWCPRVPPGFNPCFIGCRSKTYLSLLDSTILMSFNPCFIGCRSKTDLYRF